ncbi:MAG: 3-hydroxyacyl-ACP dehydratase FabZ [Oscillospiraceae bacterium]|nr:3-hydroxyacyl-ACP dehydratase FabZ [Oscillospiraceae bacterium]
MILGLEEIKAIIPHREPFLLIDEITLMEPGKRVTAIKRIREDDFWFKGHFPGQPVVPGVLMLEMLAQAGATAMLSLPENKGKIGFFGGVKEAKFRRMVVPGDDLVLEVEIIKIKGPVGIGKGIASVNGEKAVSAEISFVLK